MVRDCNAVQGRGRERGTPDGPGDSSPNPAAGRRTDSQCDEEAIDVSGSHLERGAERRRLLRAIEREDEADDGNGSAATDGAQPAIDSGSSSTVEEGDVRSELAEPAVQSANALVPPIAPPDDPIEDGDA